MVKTETGYRLDWCSHLQCLNGAALLFSCVRPSYPGTKSFRPCFSDLEQSDVGKYFKSSRTSKALASDLGTRYNPSICPMDARAGKKRKASTNSQLALEESDLLNYLHHGASHMGNFTGYGMVSQPLVGPSSLCLTKLTDTAVATSESSISLQSKQRSDICQISWLAAHSIS